jgi:nucleoid-associated protein YgaU
MLGLSRRRIAFWLVLLLFGLGAGWAAQQGWRWPSLAWFDRASAPEEHEAAPEAVAEQPVTEEPEPVAEEPEVEAPSVAAAQPEAASEPRPSPDGEPLPAATDPAAPSDQAVAEAEADPAEETAPQPAPSATAAGTAAAPPEAAAPATGPVGSAAPQANPAATGPEMAASEPVAAAPEQNQPRDLAVVGQGEAAAASAATTAAASLPTEAETEAGPEPGTGPAAGPSFDIVRVGRDGRAIIAGRAAPGADVEVRAGGQVIDRVRATRRGEWVAIPGKPLPAGDQELTAVARAGAAVVESDQVVVLAVPDPITPAPTMAGAESAAAEPVAVLLPRQGRGTGRILQAPGRLSAEGSLALMTVSYDEGGKVLLSGEAPPGVPVRIYVDNRPAAMVVGDAKGAWAAGLDEALAPGTYTLRLDQLDAGGQTVARIETPFTRVSEPPVEGNLQVDYVVVQPGNSLWRIARRLSGKGLDYVHIYGANQAGIRNPDLIYPGQVFEIPAEFGSSG